METPRFEIEGCVAEMPPPELAGAVAAYFRRNEQRFHPGPERPEGFLTEAFWRERLRAAPDELARDRALRLLLLAGDDIAGHVNYTGFVRGALQQCFLGYAVDGAHEGRGLLTRMLPLTNEFVFRRLGIHRIVATHRPTNERSARLLRRLGFTVEGYARDYLRLGGEWCDHVLTARLATDGPTPPPTPPRTAS